MTSNRVQIGFSLSSEEHGPCALVEQARRAEAVGFDFAVVSDHFHPPVCGAERQLAAPIARGTFW